jgi:hypothetical protein
LTPSDSESVVTNNHEQLQNRTKSLFSRELRRACKRLLQSTRGCVVLELPYKNRLGNFKDLDFVRSGRTIERCLERQDCEEPRKTLSLMLDFLGSPEFGPVLYYLSEPDYLGCEMTSKRKSTFDAVPIMVPVLFNVTNFSVSLNVPSIPPVGV